MVSNIFYFHTYLGKIPILTNIFRMGWNHQLDHLPQSLRAILGKSWVIPRTSQPLWVDCVFFCFWNLTRSKWLSTFYHFLILFALPNKVFAILSIYFFPHFYWGFKKEGPTKKEQTVQTKPVVAPLLSLSQDLLRRFSDPEVAILRPDDQQTRRTSHRWIHGWRCFLFHQNLDVPGS